LNGTIGKSYAFEALEADAAFAEIIGTLRMADGLWDTTGWREGVSFLKLTAIGCELRAKEVSYG
jgi:hypothetical protein